MPTFKTDITSNDYLTIRPEAVKIIRETGMEIKEFSERKEPRPHMLWRLNHGSLFVSCHKDHSTIIFATGNKEVKRQFKRALKLSNLSRCNEFKTWLDQLPKRIKILQRGQNFIKITFANKEPQ